MKHLCIMLLVITIPVISVTYNAEVIRVVDGDTIHVRNAEGERKKIRLYGIDAPEMKQRYGAKAGRYLASRIGGEFATIEVVDTDQYDRQVALVFDAKMANLNQEMIAMGFAWAYRKYLTENYTDWVTIESKAKEKKYGLWGQKKPIEPWEFRRQQRSN